MTTASRVLFILSIVIATACGPSKGKGDDGDDGVDAKPADAYCPTSISGKVFAPNGTLPLYNVLVYAPVSDPPPFTPGVQCGQCSPELPGGAYASTQSDPQGNFRLEGIPAGTDVPIIITTGKWRRKLTVNTTACVDTPIPDGEFRLPRNKTEGELPRIAIVTGGCDALACIFSKLGIDTAEFGTSSASTASVVFYNGVGGTSPSGSQASTTLHSSLAEMSKFDVVVNSCECNEHNENKTAPDLLRQYADLGGRVLGSHFHYTWTKNLVPQWSGTATWTTGASNLPDIVDQTHPGGMALARWLVATGASSTLGQIQLGTKTPNASAVATGTTRWISATGVVGQQPTTHYLSFNTPVGLMPENQCGKVVYAGMHVSNGTFPSCSTGAFTPDEKAFAYLLFDLTTCINPLE